MSRLTEFVASGLDFLRRRLSPALPARDVEFDEYMERQRLSHASMKWDQSPARQARWDEALAEAQRTRAPNPFPYKSAEWIAEEDAFKERFLASQRRGVDTTPADVVEMTRIALAKERAWYNTEEGTRCMENLGAGEWLKEQYWYTGPQRDGIEPRQGSLDKPFQI